MMPPDASLIRRQVCIPAPVGMSQPGVPGQAAIKLMIPIGTSNLVLNRA